MSGLSSYGFTFPLPRPHHVDVLAAKVAVPLPSLTVAHLSPKWAWTGNQLFDLQGDAALASFGVATFSGAGGGLDEASRAVDTCVANALRDNPQPITVPDVPLDDRSGLRLSGALHGTIRGSLSCVGAQASGTFPVGSSRLALQLSDIGVNVTVVKPPGGSPLWVFLPHWPDPVAGVRPGSKAIAFHSDIPYDKMQKSVGREPSAGLQLDGILRCN